MPLAEGTQKVPHSRLCCSNLPLNPSKSNCILCAATAVCWLLRVQRMTFQISLSGTGPQCARHQWMRGTSLSSMPFSTLLKGPHCACSLCPILLFSSPSDLLLQHPPFSQLSQADLEILDGRCTLYSKVVVLRQTVAACEFSCAVGLHHMGLCLWTWSCQCARPGILLKCHTVNQPTKLSAYGYGYQCALLRRSRIAMLWRCEAKCCSLE